jgi:hypothetical protein
MCLSSPKVPEVKPAPAPVPNASPIGESVAPTVKTGLDTESEQQKKTKSRKRGTSALQTTSGLNIPTTSGLNIS